MVPFLKNHPVKTGFLILVLMMACGFAIYSTGLTGPFLFDDQNNILRNTELQIETLSLDSVKSLLQKGLARNRPVAKLSLAMNYYFDGLNPVAYRVVNIVIHVLTGFFLYLFLKNTFSLPSIRDRYHLPFWVPFMTAVLWLVHPLHTQSVTYIIQRMTSMAAMFYILTMYLYLKGRLANRSWKRVVIFTGSLSTGLLALGTKEITSTLPFFIILYEWYFLQDLDTGVLKKIAPVFLFLLALPLALSWIYIAPQPWKHLPLMAAKYDWTIMERVLTQSRVVVHYVTLIFFPHPSRLHVDYDFSISRSMTDPVSTLLSIGLIFGLMIVAVIIAKRDRLSSFCILWFFGNLVIESSFIPLDLAAEHRTYLPSMMVVCLVVVTACRLFKNSRWIYVCLGLITALNMFWTYERNKVYADRITFWQHEVEKSPLKPRAYINYGMALLERNRNLDAVRVFTRCIAIAPKNPNAHINLGKALANLGQIRESMVQYRYVLSLYPNHTSALYNMGRSLSDLGNYQEAIDYYQRAIESNPNFYAAMNNLGVMYARQGRLLEAISQYKKALQIDPHYPDALNNLIKAREILVRDGMREIN